MRRLDNTDKMQQCIGTVKERKQEIFEKKLAAFEERYQNATQAAQEAVLAFIDGKETELQNGNITQLEADIQKMKRLYDELAPELDDLFCETVNDWYTETKADYESRLSDARGGIKTSLKSHEGERTETWTTRGGFLWLRTDYHSRTLTTVNAAAVKNSIADYIDDYNVTLSHYLETNLSPD